MKIGAQQVDFDRVAFRQLEALLQPDRLIVHLKTFQSAMVELSKFDSPSEKLKSAAHSMVSQAGLFGFMTLSGLCRDLENNAVSENDAKRLLASICSAVALAQSTIEEIQTEHLRSTS